MVSSACFCRRSDLNEERFAKIYAQKMGVEKEKMMQRMWGDSFFNAKKKADENWWVDWDFGHAFGGYFYWEVTKKVRRNA